VIVDLYLDFLIEGEGIIGLTLGYMDEGYPDGYEGEGEL
jgi:hypothetical protein